MVDTTKDVAATSAPTTENDNINIEKSESPKVEQKDEQVSKEKKRDETYLTEEESKEIAEGKKLYDGDVENALLDSIAKKGSNSVS